MRAALAIGITALATLGGCVTPDDALDPYVGQDIQRVVERIGEPSVEEDMLGQTRYAWSRGYMYPSAAGASKGFVSSQREGETYMATQQAPSYGASTGMGEYVTRAQQTSGRRATLKLYWCTIEFAADQNQKVIRWWLAKDSTPSVCRPYFQALAR